MIPWWAARKAGATAWFLWCVKSRRPTAAGSPGIAGDKPSCSLEIRIQRRNICASSQGACLRTLCAPGPRLVWGRSSCLLNGVALNLAQEQPWVEAGQALSETGVSEGWAAAVSTGSEWTKGVLKKRPVTAWATGEGATTSQEAWQMVILQGSEQKCPEQNPETPSSKWMC